MNPLDLERINSTSPYKVRLLKDEGAYEFFTRHGVHYAVDFVEDDFLLSAISYQFTIVNVNHLASPNDKDVRDTILTIIDEFFIQNRCALLYICETGDGKQSMRNRLFVSWFESNKKKNDFVIMTADIPDEEGIMNYAALIIPVDSPDFEKVVTEFKETVMMFKNKPNPNTL